MKGESGEGSLIVVPLGDLSFLSFISIVITCICFIANSLSSCQVCRQLEANFVCVCVCVFCLLSATGLNLNPKTLTQADLVVIEKQDKPRVE